MRKKNETTKLARPRVSLQRCGLFQVGVKLYSQRRGVRGYEQKRQPTEWDDWISLCTVSSSTGDLTFGDKTWRAARSTELGSFQRPYRCPMPSETLISSTAHFVELKGPQKAWVGKWNGRMFIT